VQTEGGTERGGRLFADSLSACLPEWGREVTHCLSASVFCAHKRETCLLIGQMPSFDPFQSKNVPRIKDTEMLVEASMSHESVVFGVHREIGHMAHLSHTPQTLDSDGLEFGVI